MQGRAGATPYSYFISAMARAGGKAPRWNNWLTLEWRFISDCALPSWPMSEGGYFHKDERSWSILFSCLHLLGQCWLIGITEVALPCAWRERVLLHQVYSCLVVAKRQSHWDDFLLSLVSKECLAGMSAEVMKYLFNWDNPRTFLLKPAGMMLDENIVSYRSGLKIFMERCSLHARGFTLLIVFLAVHL